MHPNRPENKNCLYTTPTIFLSIFLTLLLLLVQNLSRIVQNKEHYSKKDDSLTEMGKHKTLLQDFWGNGNALKLFVYVFELSLRLRTKEIARILLAI